MNFDSTPSSLQHLKHDFTEHLLEILTPCVYEGLTYIYNEARNIAQESKYPNKILLIFQKLLQTIDGWNQPQINEETQRIKKSTNTTEYLDDLIKTVIKSNTNIYSNVNREFYDSFTSGEFIHRCYKECAKNVYINPYLFYHDANPIDYELNRILIFQNIKEAIPRAIHKYYFSQYVNNV